MLGMATSHKAEDIARTLKLAVKQQYERDSQVKFRQIELEQRLLDLFVDIDVNCVPDSDETSSALDNPFPPRTIQDYTASHSRLFRPYREPDSALHLLLDDRLAIPRIVLEGGPGQGKSTITQMVAQIYREKFLETRESKSRNAEWHSLCRLRIPIRIELHNLAHWIANNAGGSLEQYIAFNLSRDSGGASVTVDDIHRLFTDSFVIILLDGLDEIGSDTLRDQVLQTALEAVTRFEGVLETDVRVVLTTRPPAMQGRWNKLKEFRRVILAPMNEQRVDDYVKRWLHVQIDNDEEKERIKKSFESRREDYHVEALARNPMQLSVLLQLIYLKGEAFPDRRTELYRDYFQIVIDRDVEKSPELREHRELVEGLHCYLGFLLHGKAEIEQGRNALNRSEIIDLSDRWLKGEDNSKNLAEKYFELGEERFGLIVALSGEGNETVYGFEIQPIQEYFAAAYISNRLASDKAHEVFELLIYKDYWHEVALFLAGLRRPNEKADLIARARQADDNVHIPGNQNGRAIILQLLREGVLSQPRHVQRDAMRFVMGFLETEALRLHRTPYDLIESLSEAAQKYGNDETHTKIVEIAQQLSQSEDIHLVFHVHRMAGKALPEDKYIQLVLGYSGMEPEARGMVRISLPLTVPGVIEKLSCNHTYWEGIPSSVLARCLWSFVRRSAIVPEITYPLGMHFGLILQFAIGQGVYGRSGRVIEICGVSVPAIWKLYQNIQLIQFFLSDDNEDAISHEKHLALATEPELVWTDGQAESLPEGVTQCLRDLIKDSSNLVFALRNRKKEDIEESLTVYLETISKHLAVPGIVGWIAARCAAEMLQKSRFPIRDLGLRALDDKVLDILDEFYFPSNISFSDRMHFRQRFRFGMPVRLRLASGATLRPLNQVIADLVLDRVTLDEKRYCSWLKEFPLPAVLVVQLVAACRDEMEALLRFVGRHRVPSFARYLGKRRLLKVQDTQRILKICRETHDPEILRGAAVVLINATFERLAEPTLVQKILSATRDIRFAMQLFETRTRVRVQKRDSDPKKLALSVARLILHHPGAHPFYVENMAAAFLAEVEAQRSKPLFEEHLELQGST